ncbi:hypothetical protein [Actinomadura sp. HBU206391]|uniref:hypothetical protein n=1 Tax=Actinomadura sp. HBU206391 TaxID=2731692 RepID=UPI00164F0DAD|nr:hypothetical protein [Actinomadura sp. HBU206391]MBC6458008.1 hypothetical protein [Actinomadura sp. HBU206391]
MVTAADIDQQITPIADSLRAAANAVGHPDTADRLVTTLRAALAALDALPRTDEFWAGWANDRPTITKLWEYARYRLDRDPDDRLAGRTLVALALSYGANDGGLPHLTAEVTADATVVGDAVIAAQWIWSQIGIDTTYELRRTLSAADRAAVERLAREHQGWAAVAARIALDVLDGASLDEAYTRYR